MRVEVVSDGPGLEALAHDWTRLEAQPGVPFYATHRWVSAWWSAHGDDPAFTLCVLVARQDDRVVGVAPFAVRRRSRGATTTRTLRWASHGDYLDVLLDESGPADVGTVCKALVDHALEQVGVDRLRLGNLPQDSRLLHWLLRSPHNPQVRLHVENPYIDLRRYAGLEDFEDRSVPSKTRKYRNKLHRERDVRFRVFHGDEDDVLARMSAVHRAEKDHLVARGRDERHSLYEDPRRVAQVRAAFAEDAVTFGYEDGEGTLIGYRTCWKDGARLLSWNSAYLPAYEGYRLGKVLQLDIMEHLFSDGGVDVFDLGAGRYAWKFEWTPTFTSSYVWQRTGPAATAPASSAVTPKTSRAKATTPTGPPPGSVPPSPPGVGGGPLRTLARATVAPARAARRELLRQTRPPAIYYAPHPDDETIFMGASLARTARERRVIVVPLSRGGASSARGKLATRLGREVGVEEFVSARREEQTAAVAELGVRADDVLWQDLPDGAIDADAVLEVVRRLAERHPGASHRTMSYLDPHRDHAAAGAGVRAALGEGLIQDAIFHLPVSHVPERWGTRVRLSAPDLAAKRAALREYQVWDPEHGRLAVGQVSVTTLIAAQLHRPVERTHGPDFEA